jgi:hypothetical protein
MRKIINGKQYDTDTARRVAIYKNNYSYNDFKWLCEELYRTKNGNYFLFGEGGAMTRWASSYGNSWSEGSGIKALSIEEALNWLEDNKIELPDDCPEIAELITEA